MSTLRESLADYLALRRSLGFKLGRQGKLLAQLVERLDDLGQEHLTADSEASSNEPQVGHGRRMNRPSRGVSHR